MITPELLTYIKTEIAKGSSPASIRMSLHTQGWADADINEAFASMGTRTASATVVKKGSSVVILAIVLILVLAGGAGAYYYQKNKKAIESTIMNTDSSIKSTEDGSTNINNTNTTVPVQSTTTVTGNTALTKEVIDISTESELVLKKYEDLINAKTGVPWLEGKEIKDSPDTKQKLIAKYQELWNAFNSKDKVKILSLLKEKNDLYKITTNDESIYSRLSEELDARFISKNYTLYPINDAIAHARIVIAANGKLVTLSVEDDKIFSPIFYLRKNPPGSVTYTYYFMLNSKNEFILIY